MIRRNFLGGITRRLRVWEISVEIMLFHCYNIFGADADTKKQLACGGRSVEKDGNEKKETSDWN